ncbi:hypothetical protein [Haloimpatiens massiliensis]|uniref:hypothetical protein n=1 Tax=Haloimpatiens massiliensis TaxID=1658110 RepID=UPI000C8404A5|nr:hypothetical protein [Haloimpatiens massiliensis]
MNNKLFIKISVLITVFFTWIDILLNFTMHVNQMFLVFSLIFIIYYVLKNKITIKTIIADYTKNRINKYILILLNLYILYDLITIIYSPVKMYALSKYIIIIQMYVLFLVIYYSSQKKQYIYELFLTIGIGSLGLAIISFLAYFGIIPIYVPSIEKISLLSDYNVATTTILIGIIILFAIISKILDKKMYGKFNIYISLICILAIPVIFNGGSKRAVLLLGFDLVVLLLYYIFKLYSMKKINIKSISVIIFSILISVMVTAKVNELVIKVSNGEKVIEYKVKPNNKENDQSDKNSKNDLNIDSSKSGYSINNAYKTIYKGGALSKRRIIWDIAFKDISKYKLKDILIGKGAGYSSYIYSNIYQENIQQLYKNKKEVKLGGNHPHNCFMIDILDGGIIKLLLGLGIWSLILFEIIKIFKLDKTLGVILFTAFTTIFCNNMISGRFGYIYDKAFWIFIALCMASINVLNHNEREKYENGI